MVCYMRALWPTACHSWVCLEWLARDVSSCGRYGWVLTCMRMRRQQLGGVRKGAILLRHSCMTHSQERSTIGARIRQRHNLQQCHRNRLAPQIRSCREQQQLWSLCNECLMQQHGCEIRLQRGQASSMLSRLGISQLPVKSWLNTPSVLLQLSLRFCHATLSLQQQITNKIETAVFFYIAPGCSSLQRTASSPHNWACATNTLISHNLVHQARAATPTCLAQLADRLTPRCTYSASSFPCLSSWKP